MTMQPENLYDSEKDLECQLNEYYYYILNSIYSAKEYYFYLKYFY
jgi:hypothetical protein